MRPEPLNHTDGAGRPLRPRPHRYPPGQHSPAKRPPGQYPQRRKILWKSWPDFRASFSPRRGPIFGPLPSPIRAASAGLRGDHPRGYRDRWRHSLGTARRSAGRPHHRRIRTARRMMRVPGSTVSREDLVRSVLGREFSPFDRRIDTHACNLRRKLGPLQSARRTHLLADRSSKSIYPLPRVRLRIRDPLRACTPR
jgi:hypothetical protein